MLFDGICGAVANIQSDVCVDKEIVEPLEKPEALFGSGIEMPEALFPGAPATLAACIPRHVSVPSVAL